MKLIVKAADAFSVEYDICANQRCPGTFGRSLPPSVRPSRRGERCKLCGLPRFMMANKLIKALKRCELTVVRAIGWTSDYVHGIHGFHACA
jgi:hypothetical protein